MKFLNRFLWLFVGALLLNACGDDTPQVDVGPSETFNMMEALEMNSNYTILVDAIEHAGLSETVATTQNITVFAPTNQAFIQLLAELDEANPDVSITSVTDVDAATLASILAYHVVPSVVESGNVSGAALATLEGNSLYVTSSADPINVNGKATITTVDRQASNGVFHGISSVLSIPSGGNLAEVMASTGMHTLLLAAVEQAGLTAALTGSDNYTVLAPTDDAFLAVGLDAETIGTLPAEVLAPILQFHIFAGRNYTQEFTFGDYNYTLVGTLEDDNVQGVFVNGAGVFQGVPASATNISASNGVINVLPQVIFPELTLNEAFSPLVQATGFDGLGIDGFGNIVAQSGLEIFNDISETYSVYVNLFGPEDAGSEAAAVNFVETYTFEGSLNMFAQESGTKVTSLNGSDYYITENNDGVYINGQAVNSFGVGSTNGFSFFNGQIFYASRGLSPLPEATAVDVLAANGFTYMATVASKIGRLSSGDITVLAVPNEALEDFVGVPESFFTDLDVDDPDNAGTVEFMEELIDRHTITNVEFYEDIFWDLPDATNALGETIQFVEDDFGNIRIPYFKNFLPASSFIDFDNRDIRANNGVIHVIDAPLDF